jgi:pimeloyl-ACP methyl ester carboxylesterase
MVGFTMSRLGAGGIDWRYARRGDGRTVLLLHTLRTQAEYFAALVRHLDGYDLVVPDLPGHGESSAPRLEYSASFFRNAVAAFIDKLGLSRVVVVGESIGAVVGLTLAAARNPSVVGVVALNPYDYGVRGGIRRSSVLANIVFTAMLVPGIGSVVARAAPPPLLRLIMEGGVEDSANLTNDFVGTLFKSGLRRGHARAFRSLCLEWRSWVDARESYGGIAVPVWLGYSEADWSRPTERQANRDLMPTATCVDLGAAGHFSCLEVPAVVAATVRDAACAAA